MNILNSLSLRSKIGMSFGFILILLVTASGAGVSGLQHSEEGFVKYRELARDTNLSGRLQANMLKVRMAVKNFLISHESAELEQYQNRMGLMNQFLEQSKNEISNPERSRLIMETDALLTRYQDTFDEVVALIGKEDQLYYDVLVKQGPIMRKQITQLREFSQIEANSEKMYLLGNLQEDLLLARLYLVRFLEKGHADDYNVAIEKLDQALSRHALALEDNFLTVEESELLAVFHQARTLYLAATQDIFVAQNEGK
jgi:methyl-accepting chemotaxis protein